MQTETNKYKYDEMLSDAFSTLSHVIEYFDAEFSGYWYRENVKAEI